MSMEIAESQSILAALDPQTRAERQRVVDVAVRNARRHDYCDTFQQLLSEIMPEMTVWFGGYPVIFASDGEDCHGRDWDGCEAYYRGTNLSRRVYDQNGYDQDGYDRDGYNNIGYDSDGYDANGLHRSYFKDLRNGERVWSTGYGRDSYRDADGNRRVGRGPTPDEVKAEAEEPERYNPTTWSPVTEG